MLVSEVVKKMNTIVRTLQYVNTKEKVDNLNEVLEAIGELKSKLLASYLEIKV